MPIVACLQTVFLMSAVKGSVMHGLLWLTLVSHEVCKVPDELSNEKLAAVFVKCFKVVGMELKLIVLSEHHWRILTGEEGKRGMTDGIGIGSTHMWTHI